MANCTGHLRNSEKISLTICIRERGFPVPLFLSPMKKLTLSILLLAATFLSTRAQHALQLGGDLSMLPQYEKANTPYYDNKGKKINDVITYLNGTCLWNAVRTRLFVAPTPSGDRQVTQDLAYVTSLGQRIKSKGMDLLVDFHYSDTWADPSQQSIPANWATSNTALTDSMYSYTKRSLQHLVDNGATPDFVQIGNEVSYGMLWRNANDRCYSNNGSTPWARFANFLNAAAKAVREVTPAAKIIIHVERTGDTNSTIEFYNKMKSYNVDYDIIGLSYYPFWHGTLANFSTTLDRLATSFPNKPVQVVETAYYYQDFPSKDVTNTTGTWPATPAGQKAFLDDLIAELVTHDNVTGLYYWFPEENGNGGTSWSADNLVLEKWISRGLWDNATHKANSGLYTLQHFLSAKEAVSIHTTTTQQHNDAPIYNIRGQRVTHLHSPGLYIQNGKKILKK